MNQTNKPYVLIVDDNEDSRLILSTIVTHAGIAFRQAQNGIDALKIVEEDVPALILLDLMMPEMNGFEFAFRLQQTSQTSRIPIIVISSVARAMAPRLPSVARVIEKTRFSVSELSDAIQEIVLNRPYEA